MKRSLIYNSQEYLYQEKIRFIKNEIRNKNTVDCIVFKFYFGSPSKEIKYLISRNKTGSRSAVSKRIHFKSYLGSELKDNMSIIRSVELNKSLRSNTTKSLTQSTILAYFNTVK